ncbi:hypothetical protein C8Q78DRAFT_149310 [Trametes maxima]|nr:hypothetical protein C8Q78DRAFT_149310 [Trametes maxima]
MLVSHDGLLCRTRVRLAPGPACAEAPAAAAPDYVLRTGPINACLFLTAVQFLFSLRSQAAARAASGACGAPFFCNTRPIQASEARPKTEMGRRYEMSCGYLYTVPLVSTIILLHLASIYIWLLVLG